MVLAIGTRGPRPSAKKSSGACARTFCCRTISGKISHGVRVLCSPRKPHIATITMPARKKMRRKPRSISILLVHDGDVQPAGFKKQVMWFHFTETRVARFDREKKSVIGHAAETVPVEHGMVPARQPIHDQIRKKGGKGREEHRQLKHKQEKRRHRSPVERFSMYDQRVKDPGRTEFENDRGQ